MTDSFPEPSFSRTWQSLKNSCDHSSLFTSCWIRQEALIRKLPSCLPACPPSRDWILPLSPGISLLIPTTGPALNFPALAAEQQGETPAPHHWPATDKGTGELAESCSALLARRGDQSADRDSTSLSAATAASQSGPRLQLGVIKTDRRGTLRYFPNFSVVISNHSDTNFFFHDRVIYFIYLFLHKLKDYLSIYLFIYPSILHVFVSVSST